MNPQQEKTNKEVKEAFNLLLQTMAQSNPDYYLMPKSVWNNLVKKIQYFERALKQSRKQEQYLRDDLKLIKSSKEKQ